MIVDLGRLYLVFYRKISYHLIFDAKYDQMHKARRAADGNWTMEDKKFILELFAWIM
jgi:hypothetical protein